MENMVEMWIDDGEHGWDVNRGLGKNRCNVNQWWRTWLRCESMMGKNRCNVNEWWRTWLRCESIMGKNWCNVNWWWRTWLRCESIMGKNRCNVNRWWWRTWLKCESTIEKKPIILWKTPWQNPLPPNGIGKEYCV